MNAKTNYLKLGSFVLAGTGLFVAGLFAFGARSYFQETTLFETYVQEDVEGLSVGSPVKLRGVPIGKVTKISFTWNEYREAREGYVVVQFEIRDSVSPMPSLDDAHEVIRGETNKGLRARVRAVGITGTSMLSLEYLDPALHPPLEIHWKPRNHYIPAAPGQFSGMLASIERSLRNLEKVDFGQLSATLEKDLVSAGQLLAQLERLNFSGFGTNVNTLLAELRATNAKLQSVLETAEASVKAARVADLAGNVERLLGELRGAIAKLQPVLDTLSSGPLNESLLNARAATERLDEVLQALKQYPSGFIFGEAPPPARSVKRP